MKFHRIALLLATSLSLISCAHLKNKEADTSTPADKELSSLLKKSGPAYVTFKSKSNYRQSYDTYRNETLLSSAHSGNTSIQVDLSEQRGILLVNGAVAMDYPCTTGRKGKRTPTGNFRITEKIRTKRSNIFGRCYRNGKQVYGGDRRKCPVKYTKFVGAPLPYWMRLTGDGIGMHYSRGVKRYPASAGCIRMKKADVMTVYSKTRVGTRVKIVY